MFQSLLDFLNVRPEERVQVMLMLGAGFFMGIFFATYSVVAESLFLNNLGNELNKAFLVSGFLGIIATLFFSFAQNKIKFSNLTTTSILFVVAITTFFYNCNIKLLWIILNQGKFDRDDNKDNR